MSDFEDDDDDYMCGGDDGDEEYDLEYSEDSNSEPDVDLENQYYNSKALKDQSPEEALKSFQKVLDLEDGEKGPSLGIIFTLFNFSSSHFFSFLIFFLLQENGASKP